MGGAFAVALDAAAYWSLRVTFPPAAPFVLEALILLEIGTFWFWMLVHDGELHRRLGILGETWSADELYKARKKGWVTVDNVLFERRDVDHVLVGPGGVFAIETKLSVLSDADSYVDAAIAQAQEGARKTALLLRAQRVTVTPVLFLWGPGYRHTSVRPSKVLIVAGNDVGNWVRGLSKLPSILEPDQVQKIARALTDFKQKRDSYEAPGNRKV